MTKKIKGFVGIVFLAIALITIVVGAIAMMSRNSGSNSADQTAKTNAAVIMKQAADFKIGIDRMLVDGVAPSAITFDSAAGTGLFSTSAGYAYSTAHVPPTAAFEPTQTGIPKYYYNNNVKLPKVGSSAADYVITAGPITEDVCLAINASLYGDSLKWPGASSGSLAAWTTALAAIDDNAYSMFANYSGHPEGCVAIPTYPNRYVYYKAVVEN